MFELWYLIVALMITVYVVLDGFDLGAGAVQGLIARTEGERRAVVAAIGPYWDANEVWLLAFGGALFVAFPRALSAGLSGFYLAIFLVLWCLIGRAIAIEFRSHLESPLWRRFWDTVFVVSSALLPVLFGAALGNLLRGVPLDADGWFSITLFTDFGPQPPVGVLDVYTMAVGIFALLALAAHGATFLAWKLTTPLEDRAARVAGRLWLAVVVGWPLMFAATGAVSPRLMRALASRPLAWIAVAVAVAGLVAAIVATRRDRRLAAFLGSCAFLAGSLSGIAAGLYPALLPALGDPARSITAAGAGGTPEGLRIALGWWSLGFPLVIVYFTTLFRIHRGRVESRSDGAGDPGAG